MKSQRYDDRIDADTRISNLEVIGLVGRSLRFLWPLRRLASLKFALMLLSLVPLFFYPFLPKIIVDHGSRRSFDNWIHFLPAVNHLLVSCRERQWKSWSR